MNIIGITGSSGAGKSTICNILEKEYNVKVINADKVAKKLSKKGTRYLLEISQKFGNDILDEHGELKRKKLATIIYSDSAKRKELNNCTFKYIREEIKKQIKNEKENVTIIIDAPLLFECELDRICSKVIGVISRKKLQIERIVARDNIDYEQAEKRIDAQASNDEFVSKCDEIIENNNNIDDIQEKIKQIADKFQIIRKLQ